jgi:hypothetical protein
MAITVPGFRVWGASGRYRIKVDAYHRMIAAGVAAPRLAISGPSVRQ